MPYRLRIAKSVQREIDRLPGNIRQRIRREIAGLVYNPRPAQAKAMEEELAGYYRLRVDNYRIIYTVDDNLILVEVIRVARRAPDTYDDLG